MMDNLKRIWSFVAKSTAYNLKIIFANKFIYFLLAAVGLFLLVIVISLFDASSNPSDSTVFGWLMLPGILLVFYPSVFGIQNDADSRMLEILFGVPNYRYKVWLVRLVVIYAIVYFFLLILAFLSSIAIVQLNIFEMAYQLMFPIFLLGSLAFMFSTLVRNGYGTAVFMVVIAIVFWVLSGELSESRWNLFLNPFRTPNNVSELAWQDIIVKNRIYQTVGIVLSLLLGLLNLQKREKFI
jgi:hypothetical protein